MHILYTNKHIHQASLSEIGPGFHSIFDKRDQALCFKLTLCFKSKVTWTMKNSQDSIFLQTFKPALNYSTSKTYIASSISIIKIKIKYTLKSYFYHWFYHSLKFENIFKDSWFMKWFGSINLLISAKYSNHKKPFLSIQCYIYVFISI